MQFRCFLGENIMEKMINSEYVCEPSEWVQAEDVQIDKWYKDKKCRDSKYGDFNLGKNDD